MSYSFLLTALVLRKHSVKSMLKGIPPLAWVFHTSASLYYIFMHSLGCRALLSTYCMPGTMLDAGDARIKETK